MLDQSTAASTVLVKTYPNKSMWYHEIKLSIITELYEKHYFKEINVISIYDKLILRNPYLTKTINLLTDLLAMELRDHSLLILDMVTIKSGEIYLKVLNIPSLNAMFVPITQSLALQAYLFKHRFLSLKKTITLDL